MSELLSADVPPKNILPIYEPVWDYPIGPATNLETILTEKGESFTLKKRPFPTSNTYTIELSNGAGSAEITSGEEDGMPVIATWWKGFITPDAFFKVANEIWESCDSLASTMSTGDYFQASQVAKNIPHVGEALYTSSQAVTRPFNLDDAWAVERRYYEGLELIFQQEFSWPFTIDDMFALSFTSPEYGEILWQQASGLVKTRFEEGLYGRDYQAYKSMLEHFARATRVEFPEDILGRLLDHITNDEYQAADTKTHAL